MSSRPARTWSVLVALLLAVGALAAPGSAQAATPAAAEHTFSDPVFFPLRVPANIGCANTGCDNATGAHKVWAIDFLGAKGDPVHAAGAGVAHIGGNTGGCTAAGAKGDDPAHRGRWVWVDHGAGVVSQYRHLDSIAITEGQQVTPETRLGGMGNSGDSEPCQAFYVHFEIRTGGVNGTAVDPGQLNLCTSSGAVRLPEIYGAQSWDDASVHPHPRLKSPTGDVSCAQSSWRATPNAPAATVKPGAGSATVSWADRPAGTTSVAVTYESFRTSDSTWTGATTSTVSAASSSTVLRGLADGRRYRMSVQFHNAAGWSNASARQEFVPVEVPTMPGTPRFLTWDKPYVHYGWPRAGSNGSPVTTYTVAYRCRTSTKADFQAWRKTTQDADEIYRNIADLDKLKNCEVKARGTNAVGTGAYSPTSTVSR